VVALEEEIGTAIEITGIYWHRGPMGSSSGEFGDFNIFMGQCIIDSLDTVFDENWLPYSMMQVFSRETVLLDVDAEEWFGFRLDSTYFYDGKYDLLIEVSWVGGSGSMQTYLSDTGDPPLCLKSSTSDSPSGYMAAPRCQFMLEGVLLPDYLDFLDSLATVGPM